MARRLGLTLIVTAAGCLGLATRAGAYVYWSNHGAGGIERANLDGSNVNSSFVSTSSPFAIAVSGPYVYWTNDSNGSIGRADLDGNNANPSFVTGAIQPLGVTVSGGHIYWTSYQSQTIGRANLDGTGVNQSFITGMTHPVGVTVSGDHIYWSNDLQSGTIGRANLDGTGVNQSFITGAGNPNGVTSDGTHLYWANNWVTDDSIGRANLDGTAVNQNLITGANSPLFVAVDGQHLYWINSPGSGTTIGRANLDGTAANQSFLTGVGQALGLAVDDGPDTTAPTATVMAPANGASYSQGQVADAQYLCQDEAYGSAVATCSSPVTSGSAIDTSTLGTHIFVVTTTDNAGNTSTTSVTYTVTAPGGGLPGTTISTSAPAPAAPACPAAPATWSGTRLGSIHLGMTRAQVLSAYPASSSRGRADASFICLSPVGLRVGYGAATPRHGVRAAPGSDLRGRVVWVSTANHADAFAGMRPGEAFAGSRHILPGGHLLHVGRNDWYLARSGTVTAVLKVRSGTVQEVGIATRSLTATVAQQRTFMRSFR
jgi:virginiamycin B lyase